MLSGNNEDDKKHWVDACATRLSYAFNMAGFNIPYESGTTTFEGANDLFYYVNSDLMNNYLMRTYNFVEIPMGGIYNKYGWNELTQKRGRVGHVDVYWNGQTKGTGYRWEKYYIYGDSKTR